MGDRRFVDADAALEEYDAKPIDFKLFDRVWELPASMPATPMLRVARWSAEGRDPGTDLTKAELITLASDLVPAAVLAEWTELGLGIDRLPTVLKLVMRAYLGKGAAPGEAEASPTPTGDLALSSNGGRSSRPTFDASTDFVSPTI